MRPITSPAEFQVALTKARAACDALLAAAPSCAGGDVVRRTLEEMAAATDGGRVPTSQVRERLSAALVVRLDTTRAPLNLVLDLMGLIHGLQTYLEAWPDEPSHA